MASDDGTFFHSPLSIRFSFPFLQRWLIQLAEVSSQKSASVWTQLPWRWGDEQRALVCVCMCVCSYSSSSSSLPSFFFGFLSLLAWACFSQSWSPGCRPALRSSLPQSEGEKKGRTESDGRARLWMDVLLVKAECHCVHKSIASEVKA